MTIAGCDYSFSRPAVSALVEAHMGFVVRYLSPDSGKNLSADEAAQLHAAGISIVLVWESTGTDAQQGAPDGLADAKAARQQATALGFPTNLPIYYAVDFDASSSQMGEILDYLHSAADAEGTKALVGVYGSYAVTQEAAAAGFVWLWQTYAWSAGRWTAGAVLRQIENGVTLGGGSVDLDEAMSNEYGQWAPVTGAPPPPATTYVYRATHNIYTPVAVDGDFGALSTKALQFVVGTPVDGVWGTHSIMALQVMLGVTADGIQGPVTVKALQAQVGVSQDGDWGPVTTRAVQTSLNGGKLF
jgi:hypothetical protein